MITLRLAFRNLLRSPRRSILSMAAVVVGIGVFILGEGFISGVEENVKMASIEGLNGHVLARPAGYPTEGLQHPVDELLEINEAALSLLDRETRAWTGRILFSPTAATGGDHLRVRAIGYDPQRDPQVFSRDLWRLDGTEPEAARDEVLVTPGVARLLELAPGDPLVLQVRTHAGAINALQVRVSGVVSTGLTNIDVLGILVPLPLAQRLVAAEAPTHLSARLASRDGAEAFAARLSEALGDRGEVITWQADAQDLLALQSIRRKALQFVVVILLVLAGFGMANTVLMAAHERVREIGTLRSMGMTMGTVVLLFLLEGLVLGTVGSVLGALWGGGLAAWWAANPIDMGDLVTDVGGANMAVGALIYTRFSMATVVAGIGFGMIISVLSSLYPARVASNMPPAEAVRAE
jgi:putative ABC transport system permease protein